MWFFIFQNFTNVYNFFIKRATGGLFDHYGIVSKEEKYKKLGDLFHSKFKGIVLYIIFFKNQSPRFFQIHMWTKQRRIRYITKQI